MSVYIITEYDLIKNSISYDWELHKNERYTGKLISNIIIS